MADEAETVQQEHQSRRRERSPGYPGINLETALERAAVLYDRERTNPAPVDTILHHWGNKPKSGGGMVALAALKKFGLVTDEGSGPNRKARVTDLALKIIRDQRPNSQDRAQAIREAALMPNVHRELWDRIREKGLPSDVNLEHHLVNERGFTEGGAREFIQEFKSTISFARLAHSDTMPAGDADSGQNGGSGMDGGTDLLDPPKHRTAQSMPLPVAPGEYAILQGSFPLTEDKWNQMLAVLTAMKPALVAPERPQESRQPLDDSEGKDQG